MQDDSITPDVILIVTCLKTGHSTIMSRLSVVWPVLIRIAIPETHNNFISGKYVKRRKPSYMYVNISLLNV